MLGFSLPKLLVLGLIITLVWYGFKFLSRGKKVQASRDNNNNLENDLIQSVDMEACTLCGEYNLKGSSPCEKEGCPYPIA